MRFVLTVFGLYLLSGCHSNAPKPSEPPQAPPYRSCAELRTALQDIHSEISRLEFKRKNGYSKKEHVRGAVGTALKNPLAGLVSTILYPTLTERYTENDEQRLVKNRALFDYLNRTANQQSCKTKFNRKSGSSLGNLLNLG